MRSVVQAPSWSLYAVGERSGGWGEAGPEPLSSVLIWVSKKQVLGRD